MPPLGRLILVITLLAACVDPKAGGGKRDAQDDPSGDGGSGGSAGATGTGGTAGSEGGVPHDGPAAATDGPCGAPDDPRNCGSCGHDCTRLANVRVGASVQCVAGKCVVPAAACTEGYGHCTTSADDGCETSLTRAQSCGGCTTVCSGTSPVCTRSGAGYQCASGCGGSTPDTCGTTCANLQADLQNCGKCGTICALANAQSKCEAGVCKVAACRPGYGDCTAADGCETNLMGSDRNNCGGCGFACPGAQQCANGTCTGDCVPSTTRCSPAGDAVQTCTGQGAWMTSASCPLGCDTATRACITCLPQAENCSNGKDDDCDGKADCADPGCTNGTTCGTDKVCNNGGCSTCKAGIACPSDVCKITECSSGTQQCTATSSTNGTTCGNTTCNVGVKKVYKCGGGACAETRTNCDGNCNAGGTDCQPCGAQNQECCQGKCNSGLGCLNSVCKPCGQNLQPCCPTNSCASSNMVCAGADGYIRNGMPVHDPNALCGHCGAQAEVCCPGYACNSGLFCAENAGVYCSLSCGQNPGSSCCIGPSGRSCRVGLTCDNVMYTPYCH